MKPVTAKRLRLLASAASVLLFVALALAAWFYVKMRASLPLLDGSAKIANLSAPVTVERDAQGVPTIRGSQRLDVARALGFLHAQDRFFQMDCTRRHAAGELAELFGKKALPHDKQVRIHGFRTLAQKVLASLAPDIHALVEAYTEGVNTGLTKLSTKPFEYILTRTTPQAWKPEDSVLMIYAMTLDLQDEDAGYEQSLAALRDTLGQSALAYFAPLIGPDDAALDGTTALLAPMPTERMIDIRKRVYTTEEKTAALRQSEYSDVLPGSNAFALDGARTATGSALLANDMHLSLRVPNIWYRASLVFPATNGQGETRVTGVTLPGTPFVVAGSNGSIAWGFTNSYADTADLIVLNRAAGPGTYSTHNDVAMYEKRAETILVRGEKPEVVEYSWTCWGPVVGTNADKRDLALKWVAQDPEATNFNLFALESASTVQEAIEIAHRTGTPAQNFLVADTTGTIGWTICGRLPKRIGYDGRLPAAWSYGDRKWDGFLPPETIPTAIAPADGRLWSGNQRLFGGEILRVLGDGGYEQPMRAGRIRDELTALGKATPRDLLAVQLDVQAPYLERWHQLFLRLLDPDAVAKSKDRARLRAAAEKWEGRASVDSVSYRIIAAFHQQVVDRVLPVVFEPCYDAYPEFKFRRFHYEPALWEMVNQKPPHLLGQDYGSWDDLLLAAVDDVAEDIDQEHSTIARATWGQHNAAQIKHPLSSALPGLLGSWMNMPADPLPGDNNMPRVQSPTSGASERFVVSPGHEDEGIFHMPGGQSGHPLSPFYRAGHEAWLKGEPTPFLPGTAVHTLTLKP
ncbi:MAG: penicillin acylase family protein [Verrucomicrobia bacterium]|nr:penicillin acylase family protein [Verrucomicrobiota bacterium]